jgi:uncharacterized membrane protein YgcG
MCRFKIHRCFAASVLFLFMTVVFGCCNSGQGPCNDIPPGAIPQPAGTDLCQWNHAERARADQENFVVYLYEWSVEPAKLTPNGREHVDCLAARLMQSNCPIVVETSHDERLDAARRDEIMRTLAERNVVLPFERVVVGNSQAEGLYGAETIGVAGRMLGNAVTGSIGGAAGGTGGGASGSFGGGSTSSFGGGAATSSTVGGSGVY